MTDPSSPEPLPLEASHRGQVQEALTLPLLNVRIGLDALEDWIADPRWNGDELLEMSTSLLLAVQKVDTELRRRVG